MTYSKLFERVWQTANPQGVSGPGLRIIQRIKQKGYEVIVFGSEAGNNPPDVHGIPNGWDTYGRGGMVNGQFWMEGGPGGSAAGHKNGTQDGFYWGSIQGKNNQDIIFVRGRAGVNDADLMKMVGNILDWLSKNLPRA